MALQEIRSFQRTMGFLICKLPFARWVQEIMQEQCGDLHFQTTALLTLQEVAETYVESLFEDANLCNIHGK